MEFSSLLIHWYLRNKRDLPWRQTLDPYLIWLSEIILQQTRVAQGLPYYFSFVEAFPTVGDLAFADEQQVLRLWQGLGYYSRARNLHHTAKFVANDLNGKFPSDYDGLLKLKGVGDYTAAAIASFAFGEKTPVVDGNVFRVLSRIFAVETDITSSSARNEFKSLALSLMEGCDPAIFNQAIMEFGAIQCVPKSPDCSKCTMNSGCEAFLTRRVDKFPVKSAKAKPRTRHLNYLVVEDSQAKTMIRKREGKGIWENLYEFPVLETDAEATYDEVLAHAGFLFPNGVCEPLPIYDTVHKLSHQHLHVKFTNVRIGESLNEAYEISSLDEFPFPAVLFKFIEKHWK